MYSIVLMMALSNGAATPAATVEPGTARVARYGNHLADQVEKKGCKGCKGCNGCYGCYGCYGCHGCWSCHGCYGGGYAWGCYGGGCYGGYGGGCYGGYGYGGGVVIMGHDHRGTGGATTKPKTDGKKPTKPEDEEGALDARRATLLVTLPADARLTIDDEPTRSTSASRAFVTPPLDEGKDFRYTLKAQVVRDGRPLSVTREVSVRAGQTTNVTLDFSQASVAQK